MVYSRGRRITCIWRMLPGMGNGTASGVLLGRVREDTFVAQWCLVHWPARSPGERKQRHPFALSPL